MNPWDILTRLAYGLPLQQPPTQAPAQDRAVHPAGGELASPDQQLLHFVLQNQMGPPQPRAEPVVSSAQMIPDSRDLRNAPFTENFKPYIRGPNEELSGLPAIPGPFDPRELEALRQLMLRKQGAGASPNKDLRKQWIESQLENWMPH